MKLEWKGILIATVGVLSIFGVLCTIHNGSHKNFVWPRKHFRLSSIVVFSLKWRIELKLFKTFRAKKSFNFYQIKVLRGHLSLNGRLLEINKTVPLKEQLENVSERARICINSVVCIMNHHVYCTVLTLQWKDKDDESYFYFIFISFQTNLI